MAVFLIVTFTTYLLLYVGQEEACVNVGKLSCCEQLSKQNVCYQKIPQGGALEKLDWIELQICAKQTNMATTEKVRI